MFRSFESLVPKKKSFRNVGIVRELKRQSRPILKIIAPSIKYLFFLFLRDNHIKTEKQNNKATKAALALNTNKHAHIIIKKMIKGIFLDLLMSLKKIMHSIIAPLFDKIAPSEFLLSIRD
jgi:hypothetical protein